MVVRFDIERLEPGHGRDAFECGDRVLDEYFRRFALVNQTARFGVTYVAVSGGDVIGFVTIASSQIERTGLTADAAVRLPRYPLPTLTIARLATDVRWRGQGVGTALLRFALCEALRMAQEFGCVGVRLDAKVEAIGFYEARGFAALEATDERTGAASATTPMFLPLNQIEDSLL
ncbi:MAG: GNAT family N-acetyltransferase [Actinobacteria bacterium]|nr:MAG: GNAT family N-acetyltransferase [Actinomycetota bacterium]